MGKTHRKFASLPDSQSFRSNHDRGFAKIKKRNSHHKNRAHNKNCNEDTYEKFDCKVEKMSYKFNGYGISSNKIGNVGNQPFCQIDDASLWQHYDLAWNKNETMIDMLDRGIKAYPDEELRLKENNKNFLMASKKQIERRDKIGLFYSHRE